MNARKIDAMHLRYGKCDGQYCKDCCHLISGEYHDRRYHKCELYGMSRSEATDWRLKWDACGMYNVPDEQIDVWTPMLARLVYERQAEPPLEGQMTLKDFT